MNFALNVLNEHSSGDMWIVVHVIETHEFIHENRLISAIGEFSANSERLVMQPWLARNKVPDVPGGIFLVSVFSITRSNLFVV